MRTPAIEFKVVIGTKDEIQISGASTKEDAKALGQVLQTSGYFKDRGVSVLLDRTKDAGTNASKPATTVSFVVKEGFWEKPEMVAGFEAQIVEGRDHRRNLRVPRAIA